MDSPEDKLKQQAALARARRAGQKITEIPAATDATVIGFDADKGQDIIQLSDGSIRYATPVTNGVRGVGDTVLLASGNGGAYSDTLPHIKKKSTPTTKRIQVTYPFKILFSVVEDGMRKFYVGGDRATPDLIFTIPENFPYTTAAITNLGKDKNDWVVGIKYIDLLAPPVTPNSRIKNIHGKLNNGSWVDTNENLFWRGSGFWTYNYLRQAGTGGLGSFNNQVAQLVNPRENKVYIFSSQNPYHPIIDNETTNLTNVPNEVRIYEPAATSNPLESFSGGGVNSIDAIASVNLPRPKGFTTFPLNTKYQNFYEGTGFFINLEFNASGIFPTFNTSNVSYIYDITFNDPVSETNGIGTYKTASAGASQYSIFGDDVNQIGSSTELKEVNLNLTYLFKAKLPSGESRSSQGSIVHYERNFAVGRGRLPAYLNINKTSNRSRLADFGASGNVVGEKAIIKSILLPNVKAPCRSLAFKSDSYNVIPGVYPRYSNALAENISCNESTHEQILTMIVSADLEFALCKEIKSHNRYKYNNNQPTFQTNIIENESSVEVNYWIYRSNGSRFPIQFSNSDDKNVLNYYNLDSCTLWVNKKKDLEIYEASFYKKIIKIIAFKTYLTFSNNAYQIKFPQLGDKGDTYKIFPILPSTPELNERFKFESASYYS